MGCNATVNFTHAGKLARLANGRSSMSTPAPPGRLHRALTIGHAKGSFLLHLTPRSALFVLLSPRWWWWEVSIIDTIGVNLSAEIGVLVSEVGVLRLELTKVFRLGGDGWTES